MPCPSRCLLALVVVLLLPVSTGWAQEHEPTPKELWDAYPLQPGEASPTPAAGSDVPSPAATVAPPKAIRHSTPWPVPVLLAMPFAAVLALRLVERRRQRAAEAAPPPEPRRRSFGWDHFPPPARPAPPAPPPPPFRGGRR